MNIIPNVADPAPGIYEQISAPVYHSIACASQSRLKDLLIKSPRRVRYEMDHPEAPTPAKLLGTAIHTAVLQPDLFTTLYTEAGQCEGTLRTGPRAGKRCDHEGKARYDGAWYCGTHGPKDPAILPDQVWALSADDWAACIGIRDEAHSREDNPEVAALLDGEARELTVIFIDDETGVRTKARLDVYDSGLTCITDLKTTRCAHPVVFRRQAADLGYHIQAGVYVQAAKIVGLDADDFAFVAAEKVPPYDVSACPIDHVGIDLGIRDARPLLRLWAECEASGRWPRYRGVNEFELPEWAVRRIEERTQEGVAA